MKLQLNFDNIKSITTMEDDDNNIIVKFSESDGHVNVVLTSEMASDLHMHLSVFLNTKRA